MEDRGARPVPSPLAALSRGIMLAPLLEGGEVTVLRR